MNPVDLIAESLADNDGQPERKNHEHYQSRARGVLYMLAAAGFRVCHHSETQDAIEPLTLKTEDGCFVLTELAGYTDGQRIFSQRRAGTYAIYRVVEDPTP